jgi:hypothetical protein
VEEIGISICWCSSCGRETTEVIVRGLGCGSMNVPYLPDEAV